MKIAAAGGPPLHSLRYLRRRHFNRLFAVVYSAAIVCLFYHHIIGLLHSPTLLSFIATLLLFISDVLLAYMWSTTQAFRMNPVQRQAFPEKLGNVLDWSDFPSMDIFICTADPFKEPPIDVVNTALSVMAYDYPQEKLSVYVSDDSGSELAMFAFMEAAEFAKQWVPFCRENDVMDRSPEAYFSSNNSLSAKAQEIKMIYERMKLKVEDTVERGRVSDDYVSSEKERHILDPFRTEDFTRQNHPSIVQVLLNSKEDRDSKGGRLPNLVYISREKSHTKPHHFKAGALNTLLRVSACLTNSPIVLTLDCDMYSNDPLTAQRTLCYLTDKSSGPNCAYVQFPQRYHGLNRADIYASEHKRLYRLNAAGMDGLRGPCYIGTGCFFNRRAFFGGPLSYVGPELKELAPDQIVVKPINSQEVLGLAHHVAGCTYEDKTNWGSKMGFQYGSTSEDYNTGYRLHREGWQSIFCDPTRPAYLGDVPITLNAVLSQNKRWIVGLSEVAFSKYSPLTLGIRSMGVLMGQAYANNAFWCTLSFPIIIYAFLPSLALLQGISIFPKIQEHWFLLYAFLFLGAYGQDCLDFMLTEGTLIRWWSDQRMWLIRALSSYLFGLAKYTGKRLGMVTHGFNVTSKVIDGEQNKRYDQGTFDFGAPSPMFTLLAMASIVNLIALLSGLVNVFKDRSSLDGFFVQILIAGFGVLNGLPFLEAMTLRRDNGRMPTEITIISIIFVGVLYGLSSVIIKF